MSETESDPNITSHPDLFLRKFRVIQNSLVPVSSLDTYIIKGRAFTDELSTVYLEGKPICDDSWDLNDGHVICRMMGFSGAESVSSRLTVPDDFIMDNVGCDGSEEDINDCYHLDVDNCGTREGAGVTCSFPPIPGIQSLLKDFHIFNQMKL